jgi:hypothetical protein
MCVVRVADEVVGRGHIMTIERTASGREFGVAGFMEGPGALYLKFPKSLKRFAIGGS